MASLNEIHIYLYAYNICVIIYNIIQVMQMFFTTIKRDDDKETVALACEAISATIPLVGAFCMQVDILKCHLATQCTIHNDESAGFCRISLRRASQKTAYGCWSSFSAKEKNEESAMLLLCIE